MAKPKLALYWAASCGGCEIAVLDIHEKILDVANAFDIVFWPVALDFKYEDVRAMEDKSIDLCLFNGSIRNSENLEIAHLLRAKSKVLVAFGSCALEGGIPGLANLTTKDAIWNWAYKESPSTVSHNGGVFPQTHTVMPEGSIEIPEMWETVKSLDQVVDVEYYVPGALLNLSRSGRSWITSSAEGPFPQKVQYLGPQTRRAAMSARENEKKRNSRSSSVLSRSRRIQTNV